FAVPLIDAFRPGLDYGKPGRGRPHRVIADLGVAGEMTKHLAAEMLRAHLRAEANAEKRRVVAQRHADPVGLAADEFITVIGAHRTAENHGGGMVRHGFRQDIPKARPPYGARIPQQLQSKPDAAWGRMFLVQDDQDGKMHESAPCKPYNVSLAM